MPKDGRDHAGGMTILIRDGRAGSRRRHGLMMVRRISSFDFVLYLETLPAQDGKHGVKGCEGSALNYWFVFTGYTEFLRPYLPY